MRRCVAILVVLTACATAQPHSLDLASAAVVDLTYPFDSTTLYWPTSPSAFKLTELSRGPTPGGWFYSANAFSAPEHGGTSQSASNADYRLSLADVNAWERTHGGIPTGTIVLLRTGWGKRYGNRKAYFGDDTPGSAEKLHFPSYGADAVRFLINERHVGALGVDTPSIDYGPSKDFIVHQIASAAGVPGLENVANLEMVPTRGAWIVALPMKIGGGSGAPLRIVALVPR
jgi:kynurenine formamidase